MKGMARRKRLGRRLRAAREAVGQAECDVLRGGLCLLLLGRGEESS